jgi:hypothetical protein
MLIANAIKHERDCIFAPHLSKSCIFSHVQPFYERAVSNWNRSMNKSLWASVAHSSFMEGSHMTKNTASVLLNKMGIEKKYHNSSILSFSIKNSQSCKELLTLPERISSKQYILFNIIQTLLILLNIIYTKKILLNLLQAKWIYFKNGSIDVFNNPILFL